MPGQSFKVGEMLNKRTPNSKTWINFDGSYTTEIHQGIIHYEDASGNLHNINTDLFDEADFNEIDFPVAKDGDSLFYKQLALSIKDKKKNRLNRDNYDFQGLAVPYECRIPRNIRRGYSIGKGTSKLKFIPVDASVSKGYVEGNKITYPDVWNDADLVLELLPEGIKETIILKTDKAPINFSFEVQGELAEELKIQPMWLMDAEGTKRDVLQGVSEVDDKVHLDIAADTSSLVYPIEIDPTVTIQPEATVGKDTYIYSGAQTNYGTLTDMRVGGNGSYDYWMLLQFDLTGIDLANVLKAELTMYESNYSGQISATSRALPITQPWVESVGWNDKPATSTNSSHWSDFGIVGDSFNLKLQTYDVTNVVKNDVGYGFLIKMLTSAVAYNVSFLSSDHSDLPNRPKLTVVYNQPPTAPTLTTPNGGETWNSSHTVAWTGATDSQSNNVIDKVIETSAGTTLDLGSYVAQTFRNAVDFDLSNVKFYLSASGTLEIGLWATNGSNPTILIKSVTIAVSSGWNVVNLQQTGLLANVQYAISFKVASGVAPGIRASTNGGAYPDGQYYVSANGTSWTSSSYTLSIILGVVQKLFVIDTTRGFKLGTFSVSALAGMTVKMTRSGLLKKVRMKYSSPSKTKTISIKDVVASGSDWVSGNTTLTSASITGDASGFMTWDLATPLSISDGQRLAFEINDSSDGQLQGGSGYYADGNMYYGTSPKTVNGNDAWVELTIDEATPQNQLKYQIQLSTNNGSTWKDMVALTAAGTTSYPYDFINEAETSTALIRVRAYDGSSYGPWDQSNGVFTIVHNQAPTAPTGLSPSGEPKDRASIIRFGWLHNDPNSGDPQSKFDLQWRLQGSPTWNTVSQASTNNYYDMPANTLPKGTIEWQVRTYDQAGLPSPYSALQVFIAGDKLATPTFVTPADGSTVAVSKPVVQWSSDGQTDYQVKVLNAAGTSTLWDTGQINSTNKAVTVGIDLENETDYDIQVLIKNADGIWSNHALSNIHVSYTPPALPILTTRTDSEKGMITVEIDNPLPVGTEPTVLFNDLFRLETDGVWERIATNIGADGLYTDYTVASGKNYQYKVIVVGDNETVRESGIISNSVTFKGIYLQVASDPLNTSFQFKNDSVGRSSKWNLNHTYHKFAGRNNLVIDTEDSIDYGVDFTLKLKTAEELAALERIIYSQEVVCYRDGRGRKVFGVFTGFPLEDATWGESTSLNLMKIDYKEEVL